ncbi:hypothetical protein D3C87_1989140 [compost metagenome]
MDTFRIELLHQPFLAETRHGDDTLVEPGAFDGLHGESRNARADFSSRAKDHNIAVDTLHILDQRLGRAKPLFFKRLNTVHFI